MSGHEESINYVIEHCQADVLVLEELYTKLRPLVRMHPRVSGWLPCRACGSTRLQRRGFALTSTKGRRLRVQCQNCGAWETRSEEHSEIALP